MPVFVLLQHHAFILMAVCKLFAAGGVFSFDSEPSIITCRATVDNYNVKHNAIFNTYFLVL